MPTVRVRWGLFSLPVSTPATLEDAVNGYLELAMDVVLEQGPVTLAAEQTYAIPFEGIATLHLLVLSADMPMQVSLTSPAGTLQALPVQEELLLLTETSAPTAMTVTGPGTFTYAIGGME